ncbi:MAG: hypothetical protein CMG17_00655 [Candidatus Marinimicrobia bacterium]|nr:hypothetical protein [Candidatus Neomarinimicrobiota bacterium]
MKRTLLSLIILISVNANSVDEFPVEHFFKDPSMLNPQLSPDGQYLAALIPYNINRESQKQCKNRPVGKKTSRGEVHLCDVSRRNITVIHLGDKNKDCQSGRYASCSSVRVTQLRSQNVSGFFWANNERIIFTTGGDQLNGITGAIDSIGLYAVNKDGTKPKQLVKPEDALTSKIISTIPLNRLDDDEDHILVMRNDRKRYLLDVYKMNVYTGKFFRQIKSPGPVINWAADRDGVLRLATFQDEESLSYETKIMYRDNEEEDFREIDRFEGLQNGWAAIGWNNEQDKIYVTSNLGRDTYSIGLLDPKTGEIEDVFESEGTDVGSMGFTDNGEPITVLYRDIDTKPQRHYVNDKWKNIIEGLENAFGVDYVGISSISQDETKLVLNISSDINPGDYYLYDREKNNVAYLGSVRPWIDPKTMSPMKPVSFEARDGETIYGFLTVPKNSDGKNLPMILNPHGGPFGIQDIWRFNGETQFFANQGYAVMQVNFRGSGGYGKRYERIGYKRWGLEMQDDLTDAVKWAVKEGIVDPDRVCIYGASYGGYATMAGITLTPELYSCAVNYVGIWDLEMLYRQDGRWDSRLGRWFRNHVIDVEKDQDQLEKTSPKYHIDKIQAPLFIVHGRKDYNVRVEQAETLMEALDEKGIPYEAMIKREEGHGFTLYENKVDLYTQMKRFFKENLSE